MGTDAGASDVPIEQRVSVRTFCDVVNGAAYLDSEGLGDFGIPFGVPIVRLEYLGFSLSFENDPPGAHCLANSRRSVSSQGISVASPD
jgi:hypothetical protein